MPNDPVSRAIRIGTWSQFSHAAICTDPPLFVEAVGVGVRPRSILGMGVRDKQWVRVLRLKADMANHADRTSEAARHADRYLVHGYWVGGALATKLPGVSLRKRSKFFCSHLVAQAYMEAGIDLVPGLPPSKVTPKAISHSSLLCDITEDILIPTNERDWPLKLDLTDVGIGPSPVDQEIEIRRRVAERMESALRTYREDLLDESVLRTYGIVSLDKANRFHIFLTSLICANKDNPRLARTIDSYFVRAIKEEGYLSIPEMLVDEASLYLDQAATYFIEQGLWDHTRIENTLTFYQQNYATLLKRIDEMRNYTDTYKKCFKETGLKTFDALAKTHECYWDYCQGAREVLRKTIALLESVLERN